MLWLAACCAGSVGVSMQTGKPGKETRNRRRVDSSEKSGRESRETTKVETRLSWG